MSDQVANHSVPSDCIRPSSSFTTESTPCCHLSISIPEIPDFFSPSSRFRPNSQAEPVNISVNGSLGALLCAAAESALKTSQVQHWLPAALKTDLSVIFAEAAGLDNEEYSDCADTNSNLKKPEDYDESARLAKQLGAKIKLLVFKALEYLDAATTEFEERTIIKLLQFYGFHVYVAKLSLIQHYFWVLIPPDHMKPTHTKLNEVQFVLDFDFPKFFEKANPSPTFKLWLSQNLRNEFVGSISTDLPEAIEWLGRQANQFSENQTRFSPWLQMSLLQLCYMQGIKDALLGALCKDPSCAGPSRIADRFVFEQGWIFHSLGFTPSAGPEKL